MRRKIYKILVYGLAGLVLLIALGLSYLKFGLPNVGAPMDLTIEGTPEQIERGDYLANHVMLCMDCHSKRDWTQFSGPLVAGTEGMGGEVFDQRYGFPGKFVSSNLTPANLENWTDGEIFRAITTGVSKDGRALFPIMPHHNFGQLDERDIKAVIAYIRTLPPIENATEASSPDFPMNFIINTIPKPANLQPRPDDDNLEEYGKYLVMAASCYDCHTRQEQGQFVGQPFAGGMEFPFPDGSVVRSPNITPHISGIGSWSETQFISKFKSYADSSYVSPVIQAGEFQTMMPWTMYAELEEQDLKAMYAYLKSIEPVDNTVERFASAR